MLRLADEEASALRASARDEADRLLATAKDAAVRETAA